MFKFNKLVSYEIFLGIFFFLYDVFPLRKGDNQNPINKKQSENKRKQAFGFSKQKHIKNTLDVPGNTNKTCLESTAEDGGP